MATRMSTTSIAPRAKARTRRLRPAHPAPAVSPVALVRVRSPQAAQALETFGILPRYFAHDAQLAQALGWDSATVAVWREGGVVRPQSAKVAYVKLLADLCEEAGAYLRRDTDVGAWICTSLPNLRGASPAEWLATRGPRGLRELTYAMVDWMPRVPDSDLEPGDGHDALADLVRSAKTHDGAREALKMLRETP
jgi:hypothetical protein